MAEIRRPVGAVVPLRGRYSIQGAQMLAGVELWASSAGRKVLVEDDESSPAKAASLHAALRERCSFVLGPYGSDSTRAVARSAPPVVWNHGAAADDVQRLAGVISLPTPSSRYLVALARAVERIRPGARVVLVTVDSPFGEHARAGLEAIANSLAIELAESCSFPDALAAIERVEPEVVLACGPLERELELIRLLRKRLPELLYGGLAPGLRAFPGLLGHDPEGLLAPVQWHPELRYLPTLGPSVLELMAKAPLRLDYVGAQAFAAALIAEHCLALEPADPGSAARSLRTTTFYGAFELDPVSNLQVGHRLSVIRWHQRRQELLLHAT